MMNTEDTLLAYSEWMDSEGLVVSDDDGDDRTHSELVDAFLEYWDSNPDRATLAGREPRVGDAVSSSHVHVWSLWYAKDRSHKYRSCVHPDCPAVETAEIRV